MKKTFAVLLLPLLLNQSVPLLSAATTPGAVKTIQSAQSAVTPLNNQDVLRMVKADFTPETIIAHGGTPIRSRVGHSFIKQVMAETGAAFGGEHSGHYYFRDNFRADSGLIAGMFVLEALSTDAKPLSEVLAPYRRYWSSGELNTEVADLTAKLKELAEAYSDGRIDWLDGLTVDYPDWWFNARPSNTEPLLRLNVEATTAELGESKTSELLALISR